MKFKSSSNKKKKHKGTTYRSGGSELGRSSYNGVERYDSGAASYNNASAQADAYARPDARVPVERPMHAERPLRDEGVRRGGRDAGKKGGGKKGKKKGGAGRVVLVVIIILVLGLSAAGVLFALEIGGSGSTAKGEVVVTVPEGASTSAVAKALYDEKLIGNVEIFKIYSKLKGADGTYQMGDHTVTGGMSYNEIIEILQQTTYVAVETFTMIFPEGTTALKMALMLEQEGFCTVDEFINACNYDSFDVGFFNQITNNQLRFIKLEGFLYPDTYEFEVGSTVHDVIQKMLENFEKKVLTDQFKSDLAGSRYTLEEAVILASIIQKESFGGYEKDVSSVFNNRLAPSSPTGGRLESNTSMDTDLNEGFIRGVLDYYYGGKENVPEGMREAYNTYKVSGLIVGAICNPGAEMVDAAINPNDTPYIYFCTDNAGKFYFAETYAEHVKNWDDAQRVNRELENGGTGGVNYGGQERSYRKERYILAHI